MVSDRSQHPYLLRAMHEWMSDCGHTPHVVVNAEFAGIQVPSNHIKDGRIILNVSYSAAHNLDLGNDELTFEARFSGTPFHVRVPVAAILGIYARETGQGMVFSEPDAEEDSAAVGSSLENDKAGEGNRPNLRVVK